MDDQPLQRHAVRYAFALGLGSLAYQRFWGAFYPKLLSFSQPLLLPSAIFFFMRW